MLRLKSFQFGGENKSSFSPLLLRDNLLEPYAKLFKHQLVRLLISIQNELESNIRYGR